MDRMLNIQPNPREGHLGKKIGTTFEVFPSKTNQRKES
jgi:hypothetical protein